MAGERNDTADDGGTEKTEFTITEGNMMLHKILFCHFDKSCNVLFLPVCAVCNELGRCQSLVRPGLHSTSPVAACSILKGVAWRGVSTF